MIKKQELYNAVACVFEHERDFMKNIVKLNPNNYTLDQFHMAGFNCKAIIKDGYTWQMLEMFVNTDEVLDFIESKGTR